MIRTYAVGNFNTASRLDDHTGPWVDLVTLGDADSQWRDVMSDPTNPDKVIIVGSGQGAFPLSGNVSIQVSTDAGATWSIPGGNWADTCDFFHEVWYVDTNTIWAVNSSGLVVRSLDGGATFDTVTQFGAVGAGDTFWTSAIHAIDDQVAVVLGAPTNSISELTCYVWKTIDGGNTWNLLNGGATLFNSIVDPVTGQAYSTAGTSNAIWMSPDEEKIVATCSYAQFLSTDGTLGGFTSTFNAIGIDTHRSGIHGTWFPSYDPDPQYHIHTGGFAISCVASSDNANSYDLIRANEPAGYGVVPPGNTSIIIRGAHQYAPLTGYYSYNDEDNAYIEHSTNNFATGTLSNTKAVQGATYEAIWTSIELSPITTCYELRDCAEEAVSIFTQTDLSEFVGQVISIQDETGHEAEGCWTVIEVGTGCEGTDPVLIYRCYDDCEHCLPEEEPIQTPCPRGVQPGYTTGNCDPEIVEKVKCTYSELMYQKMMSNRYKIEYCCPKDEEKAFIEYEKIRLKLLEGEDPTPDPCNPECYSYEIEIAPEDSAITTYIDCFEEEQIIITDVNPDPLALPRTIGFCALDTSVPTSVVTHPDLSIDTYILERVDGCTPPWVDPRACIGYHVEMSNYTIGDISFRYLDCDGIEVVVTKVGNAKDIEFFDFCGLEGQIFEREGDFIPTDIFTQEEGPCTGLPPCVEYTVVLNNPNAGTIRYVNCQGQDSSFAYQGQDTDQELTFCGISGQTLVCTTCNFFSYSETGNC